MFYAVAVAIRFSSLVANACDNTRQIPPLAGFKYAPLAIIRTRPCFRYRCRTAKQRNCWNGSRSQRQADRGSQSGSLQRDDWFRSRCLHPNRRHLSSQESAAYVLLLCGSIPQRFHSRSTPKPRFACGIRIVSGFCTKSCISPHNASQRHSHVLRNDRSSQQPGCAPLSS